MRTKTIWNDPLWCPQVPGQETESLFFKWQTVFLADWQAYISYCWHYFLIVCMWLIQSEKCNSHIWWLHTTFCLSSGLSIGFCIFQSWIVISIQKPKKPLLGQQDIIILKNKVNKTIVFVWGLWIWFCTDECFLLMLTTMTFR